MFQEQRVYIVFRFIAQKSDELFEGGGGGAVRTTLENDHTEDHSALLPPLETFGHLNESIKSDDRLRHFFNVSFFHFSQDIHIR